MMLADETTPFVLLDDARPGGTPARLYRAPVHVVRADRVEAVAPALSELRAAGASGLHAAGFLSYEAAAALEPAICPLPPSPVPLLWFGLFERYEPIAADDVAAMLPDPAGVWIDAPEPAICREAYDTAFAAILAMINAGDLYQANLSFRAHARFLGDPLALYARLRATSAARYSAVVDTGDDLILSLSPELFFGLDAKRLTCRPMKGTARRGDTAEADRNARERLAADPKQRAENLMIVDLMRNDLSRVALPGTVHTAGLFEVETYPTVHQLVSTVYATLAPRLDAVDALSVLFPCGSITGAPKIGAINALNAIERGPPRGSYTGAIGRIDAGGDAEFNVAIRTLLIPGHGNEAVIGLGGGIVADSHVDDEWDECLAKAAFMTVGARRFDLIETMAFDPSSGILRLEAHLARLKKSAKMLGFFCDRHAVRNELQAATFRLQEAKRIRLLLAGSGATAVEVTPMPDCPAGPVEVAIVPLPVVSSDFRLRHKTSDRSFYDRARRATGRFEIILERPDGYLTEGSFTSLFVPVGDILLTPPLDDALLPGILRAGLIESGHAVERRLRAADLTDGFFIGNALRGLIPAVLAEPRTASL